MRYSAENFHTQSYLFLSIPAPFARFDTEALNLYYCAALSRKVLEVSGGTIRLPSEDF